MGLETLIRFGYILLIVTMFLMIWSSLAGAKEIEQIKYPPCTFNPLCACSKPAPDLGIVQCRHVPFPAIPKTINTSKVFMLHMENTGLRELEPYFLQTTGLYRLEISNNPLTEIPDDSFIGLERSLWELMLQNNELIDIPSRAIRHLQKLRHLDLSGNQISCVEPESFRGLEDSLQTLILSKNSLNSLPPDSFSTLPNLDTIDLSGNNIAKIDANIFRDGMPKLSKLILADNVITEIPYIAIAPLKQLRTIDLSHNLIRDVQPMDTNAPTPMVSLTLDTLHLEYNLVHILPTASFQNFGTVNKTFLDGNPITVVGEEAFRSAKIRELYIRHCKLHFISPIAFEGLGGTLEILDLSGNNITSLPENLFSNFDTFRVLNLKDNRIHALIPAETFNVFQFTLQKLDLSGESNVITNLQDLRRMRNIRSLSLTRLSSTSLGPDDFLEFGLELEDLKITRGSLKTIKSHAFKHIRGIKRLDLSENRINQIEPDAFNEIGHSLISLKISSGMSLNSVPTDVMRHLTSLQELDLSNNQIKTMSDTCFHFLKDIHILALHDNQIEQVLKGTFQGDIHSKLETILLSFNNLKHITQHTFVDLVALERLHLDDNRIEHIERRAFMNLDQLRYLNLRGNKLNSISDEAFQVYEGDSLPQNICCNCVDDVNRYFAKIQRYKDVEQQWIEKIDNENEKSQRFLEVRNIIEHYSNETKAKISELIPELNSIKKYNLLNINSTSSSILKKLLLNKHIYKVKSLQQLCIDFFNDEGPNLLDSILKVELPPLNDQEESINSSPITSEINQFAPDSQDDSQETSLNSDGVKKIKRRKLNPLVSGYINRKRSHRQRWTKRRNIRNSLNGDHVGGAVCINQTKNLIPARRIKKEKIYPLPIQIKEEPMENCETTLFQTSSNDTTNVLEFNRKISVKNVLTGKRQRNRPARLSDVLTEKILCSRKMKLELAKANRLTKSLEKKSNETLSVESEATLTTSEIKTPLIAQSTDTVKVKKSKKLEETSNIVQPHPTAAKYRKILPKTKEQPMATLTKVKIEEDSSSLHSEGKSHSSSGRESKISTSSESTRTSVRDSSQTPPIRSKSITPKLSTSTDDGKIKIAAIETLTMSQMKRIDQDDDKKHRSKQRINYSEALVDEALMYEEILMDKEAKEQKVIATTIKASKKPIQQLDSFQSKQQSTPITATKGKNDFSFDYDDTPFLNAAKTTSLKKIVANNESIATSSKQTNSTDFQKRLSEISITPVNKPNAQRIDSAKNQINSSVSLNDIKKEFKSNPDTVFNISSAVSIQLKSPTTPSSSSINNYTDIEGPQMCKYCEKMCLNIKQLAVHQLQHLQIATCRIDHIQILDPKHRRGRMVPMGTQKCFRCLNCWRLHPNSQSILEHWVTGKCLFYCSICGESFHSNPKMIRIHFPMVHGIKYRVPDDALPRPVNRPVHRPTASQNGNPAGVKRPMAKFNVITPPTNDPRMKKIIQRVPGRVTCEICSCSFPNMQSRNSHMRLHKKERLVEQMSRPGGAANNLQQMKLPMIAGQTVTLKSGQQITLKPGQQFQMKRPIQGVQLRPVKQLINPQHKPVAGRFNQHQRTLPNHMAGNMRLQVRPQSASGGLRINQVHGNIGHSFQQQQHPHRSMNAKQQVRRIVQRPQPTPLPSQHQRAASQSQAFNSLINSFSSVEVKTELPDFHDNFVEYNSTDYSNDDYMVPDFGNILPLQPEIVMTPPESVNIKTEPNLGEASDIGGAPRLQVKKLHELQEPTYGTPTPSTYYQPAAQHQPQTATSQQPTHQPQHTPQHHQQQPPQPQPQQIQQQPSIAPPQPPPQQQPQPQQLPQIHHQPQQTLQQTIIQPHQNVPQQHTPPTTTIIQPQQYQIAPQHIQLQVPQMQTIQFQPQPQFQISSAQQVQNTQYYNPVFVVQHPHQTNIQPDIYQYGTDQIDYSKYYS